MQSLFDSMANATPPTALQTQRRGVLSGGGVNVANPIMTVDLVNFTPPDFDARCGGIDFFGGSFSFINADQYVQLMRAVASVITRKAIRRGVFKSVSDLKNAIIRYIRDHNKDANPFVWTKPADEILGKIQRFPVPSE